ncbi:MAG: dihydropteroate synthase [Candidatus Glassbacteria bacterium]|nr:dihydropteroate synthase [Candidatus Glassbacteria bacterium]
MFCLQTGVAGGCRFAEAWLVNRYPWTWKIGGPHKHESCGNPRIIGILNVTGDSFYDGGRYLSRDPALEQARRMFELGAEIIDVGGESTRPGAEPVQADLEIARVVPVIRGLAARLPGALISVDTYKASVARAAVDAGAHLVNDVSAGLLDEKMLDTVAGLGAGYVIMHMRGKPRTMQQDTHYENLTGEIYDFFAARLERAAASGIDTERIALDPGIGFGKSAGDNYRLIAGLGEFFSLGRPLVVGPSRKSFMALAGQPDPEDRLEGTLAACTVATLAGADYLRVHDAGPVSRAVAVAGQFLARGVRAGIPGGKP